MKLTLRAVAAGTFLTALTVAGLTAHPALAQEIGLDFWHVPDLRAGLRASERRARELEQRGEVTLRRVGVRAETVDDLIAGRLTVADAVRRFDELNRSEPTVMERVRRMYPGATDEERAGWQLGGHGRTSPDPRAAAVADEAACWVAYPDARRGQ